MNKNYLPFIIPLIIFLAGVGFLGYAYYKNVTSRPGALQVSSKYNEADVTFRGKSLGKTPLEVKDLKPGRGELVVKGSNFQIKKDIFITEGALTVVSADTGISDKFNANMTIWYDKSSGGEAKLFVTSNPTNAKIKINDKEKGETPLTISEKDLGESNENMEYAISIDKDGYEGQVINLKLEKGYILNLSGNLFLNPVAKNSKKQSNDSHNLFSFKASELKENPGGGWASAISYFINTRGGVQIDNETIESFEYYVDNDGNLYNKTGSLITNNTANKESGDQKVSIAYLNSSDKDDVSDKAKETISKLFGTVAGKTEYTVTETGLGYLNVRSKPDVSGELLGKINVGTKVTVKELQGDWYKIDFNGKDGFVSATYVKKNENKPEISSTPSPKITPSTAVKASPAVSPKVTPKE